MEELKKGKLFKPTCPHCGRTFEVNMETAFFGKDLEEGFKPITCPSCGHSFYLNYPFTYMNEEGKYFLVNDPKFLEEKNVLAFKLAVKLLEEEKFQDLKGYKIRITGDFKDLLEKIYIFDRELDDGAMEIMKALLEEGRQGERLFYNQEGGLSLQGPEALGEIDFPKDLYERILQDYQASLKNLPYLVDRTRAKKIIHEN